MCGHRMPAHGAYRVLVRSIEHARVHDHGRTVAAQLGLQGGQVAAVVVAHVEGAYAVACILVGRGPSDALLLPRQPGPPSARWGVPASCSLVPTCPVSAVVPHGGRGGSVPVMMATLPSSRLPWSAPVGCQCGGGSGRHIPANRVRGHLRNWRQRGQVRGHLC